MPENIENMAKQVLNACGDKGVMIATAESCTGGMISAALTAIPGSSSVIDRGFVTYTNAAKHEMLGVPNTLFDTVGAVSGEVACAMSEGALSHSQAQISVSVTGIAGPGGGSADKPVGLVFIAVASVNGETRQERHVFSGDREAVRTQTVTNALALVLKVLEYQSPS